MNSKTNLIDVFRLDICIKCIFKQKSMYRTKMNFIWRLSLMYTNRKLTLNISTMITSHKLRIRRLSDMKSTLVYKYHWYSSWKSYKRYHLTFCQRSFSAWLFILWLTAQVLASFNRSAINQLAIWSDTCA